MEWIKLFAVALAAFLLAGCVASPQQQAPAAPESGTMPIAPGNDATPPAPPAEPEGQPEQQSPPAAPEIPAAPQGKPDLQLQSMALATPVTLYQMMNGTITNYNSGTAESPATKTAYYIDGEFIGTVDVPPIAPGDTNIARITVICQSVGQHTLSGKIDYEGLIEESDEQNNGAALSFTCTG